LSYIKYAALPLLSKRVFLPLENILHTFCSRF